MAESIGEKVVAHARANKGSTKWQGMCQAFVADMVAKEVQPRYSKDCAKTAEACWGGKSGNPPAGAAVYMKGSAQYGHVGIATGEGKKVVHAYPNIQEDDAGAKGIYKSWGWNGGIDLGSKASNTTSGSTGGSSNANAGASGDIKVGSKVRITGSTYANANNTSIPNWVKQGSYVVSQISGNKALLDKTGICSWVYLKDLVLDGSSGKTQTTQSTGQSKTTQTTTQTTQSSGTKLDQLLASHPNVTTNQDLINLFYSLGGNNFNGAASKAKEYGVDINNLCSNRQGKVARSASTPVEEPKQTEPPKPVETPKATQTSGGTKLDQLLESHPNVKTNQDLINLFYSLGGNNFNGAAKKAQEYGVNINTLCNNRSGTVARSSSGSQVETPKQETPKTETPKTETPKTETPKTDDPNSLETIVKNRGFKTNQDLINYFLTEIGGGNWTKGDNAAKQYGLSLNALCSNRSGSALETAKGKVSSGGEVTQQTAKAVTGDAAVANFIRDNYPNGFNACFAYPKTGSSNDAEFQNQAGSYIKEYNTIGISNGKLSTQAFKVLGSYSQFKQDIIDLTASVKKCLADHPRAGFDDSKCCVIKNLSILCHGYETGLNFGNGNYFRIGDVQDFAKSIKGCVATDVRVQLYACNTARNKNTSANWYERKPNGTVGENDPFKGGEGSFAQALSAALGEEASVYGHTTAGHLTGNYAARVYGKDADGAVNGKHMFDVYFPASFIKEQANKRGTTEQAMRTSMYSYYTSNYNKNNQARGSFIDPEGYGKWMRDGWLKAN